MLRKVPLIVILGSTGTGKTKLSIEIAEHFGGEIISADSMQVYANLDIVTAKATKEEQSRVPHHLLNVGSPSETFTVVHFRNAALQIIENLLAKNKCPVVVGGTNYYIESLLWDILVSSPHSPKDGSVIATATTAERLLSTHPQPTQSLPSELMNSIKLMPSFPKNIIEPELLDETLPSDKLYERLKGIDPLSAERIHPNNKRKIIRALEVYSETGVPLSEILKEQRNKPGGNRLGGPLRYPHTILFWLQCNQDILNQRLNKRVDSMLEQGLLEEVRNFYEQHSKISNDSETFTKGILQSIGFKEFVPYLQMYDQNQDNIINEYLKNSSFILSENKQKHEPEGLDLLRKCLDELKLITQRYSRKQIKWIKNRFLGSKDRQVPRLYALDTSNVDLWDCNVYKPAIDVIESYINNKKSKLNPLKPIEHPAVGLNEEVANYCSICKRHFTGEFQWNLHLKSNKHKKVKEGLKRKEKLLSKNISILDK